MDDAPPLWAIALFVFNSVMILRLMGMLSRLRK